MRENLSFDNRAPSEVENLLDFPCNDHVASYYAMFSSFIHQFLELSLILVNCFVSSDLLLAEYPGYYDIW